MPVQDKGVDFIAYDDAGRTILVAEVKSRIGTSEVWATRFRRNMLAHGVVPKARFFLIATPEHMYFWKQDENGVEDRPPEFTLDAKRALRPHMERLRTPTQTVSEQALELLVLSWLTNIAQAEESAVKEDPSMRWLSESGLIGSLEKARIETTTM
jgi:hypothetical protein